jgi:microcystin-dependent protein
MCWTIDADFAEHGAVLSFGDHVWRRWQKQLRAAESARLRAKGPGLSLHDLGETGGEQTVTLLTTEMPAHSHSAACVSNVDGNQNSPQSNVWAKTLGASRQQPPPDYSTSAPNQPMNPLALSIAGGSLPHNNMSPFLGLTFIIALQGVFPARS